VLVCSYDDHQAPVCRVAPSDRRRIRRNRQRAKRTLGAECDQQAYRRHIIPDEQGQTCPMYRSRREAIQSARELLAGAIRVGQTSVPDAS
jgi:hypothetical protein